VESKQSGLFGLFMVYSVTNYAFLLPINFQQKPLNKGSLTVVNDDSHKRINYSETTIPAQPLQT